MDKTEYYVYGLVDPRDNQYFYIGKGKGKRFAGHLKPKKLDFNTAKHERIKAIEKSGLEVKIDIIFPNLLEETAFELERILIYKLGREILGEGVLTNLNPGGRWKPGDSVFYSDTFKPHFDLNKLDVFSQQKFEQIQTISQFNYLNITNREQILYKYNKEGLLSQILSLNEFLSQGVRGHEIKIIKAVRENSLPVYCRWIYSKLKLDKIYISKYIPLTEYDIIDQQFHQDFDKKYSDSEYIKTNCIVNDVKRLEVEKNKDTISSTSYYISGNKKSFRKTKLGKSFGISFEWFENGNIRVKEELIDGCKDYIRTTYYESGLKHIKTSRIGDKKTYYRWFENGLKEVEYIENHGYVYYNEKGKVIRTEYSTE